MKLYYFDGSCSLATHIALREAGMDFDLERVDLFADRVVAGRPFTEINAKGYVPALVLDDGSMLTETVALLDWVAQQSEALRPDEGMARTRQLESLAFISTEIHKRFLASFFLPGDEAKPVLRERIEGRFGGIAERMKRDYLTGERFSVADAFLYVMLRWARMSDWTLPDVYGPYMARIEARPAVKAALEAEGQPAMAG